MLNERSNESIKRIVSLHKAEATWSSWHQRFVKEYGDINLYDIRVISYHDSVTARFLEKESATLATRFIVLGSSVTLGLTLEAEQMWQLMERKF